MQRQLRRETRRRRPRRGARRRRQLLLVGLIGVVVVVAAVGAVLARDVWAIRDDITRADAVARDARDAVVAGDVETALPRMSEARSHLSEAVSTTQRPLWRLVERAPVVGDPFASVTEIVETADTAIGIAYRLVNAAPEVIGPDGRLEVTATDGRIDLDPLVVARDVLADAPLERLRRSADAMRARDESPLVPAVVEDARARTLSLADEVLEQVGLARTLTAAVPDYLGVSEPRRYFLAMQNPAELRGTGGLIGFYAVVTVDDGLFTMTEPTSYEVLSPVRPRIDRSRELDAPEDFLARYGDAASTQFLANINLDPSLPVVAPRILDLYEAARGDRLDGVIMVDPLGLQDTLAEIGPVTVPAGLGDPRLPNPVPADQLPRTLMIDAYDVLGGNTDARETYLRELATEAFERIFDGGYEAVPVATRVARTALDGHLQLYSTRPTEQARLQELGVAGSVGAPEGMDWFAATGVNAAGNKADVFAGHRVHLEVALQGGPGAWLRVANVGFGIINDLDPAEHDPYIANSAEPGQGFRRGFDGPLGLNRTQVSIWGPPDSLPSLVDDEDNGGSVFDGRRVLDHTLEVPAGASDGFTSQWVGPVTLRRSGDGWVYELEVEHQTKAVPDRLTLEVDAPRGMTVTAVEVVGGGSGRGQFGPHATAPEELRSAVEDGSAVVTGDLTRDVRVRVHLVRA